MISLNISILNTFLKFLRKQDIKVIVILALMTVILVSGYKYYSVVDKYNNIKIANANAIAEKDTLKILNKNISHKLIKLSSENDLKKIEINLLNEKIKGDVIALNSLKFRVNVLKDSLESVNFVNKIKIKENIYDYKYTELFKEDEYSLKNTIYVTARKQPINLKMAYEFIIDDINLIISTRKEDDYKYSILVKTDSEIFKLVNATGYLNIPKPKVLDLNQIKPNINTFWKKFNLGFYGGVDVTNELGYFGSEILFNYMGSYSMGYTYIQDGTKYLSLEYEWCLRR